MEGADSAFFYTARAFGISPTVICLTEQTHLDWRGRIAYIGAKMERRKTELYAMDLVWMLARKYYDIQMPQPTKYELDHTPADKRSGAQIAQDLLKKIGD